MPNTTRLPDYWTHLDGSPCLSEVRFGDGVSQNQVCDDHDRVVRPPLNTEES